MLGDFKIVKKCSTTDARVSIFELNDTCLELPIFMPVGTYGAMKGIRVPDLQENMILTNTYHLRKLGKNIKRFMKYNRGMLTDSGGFQIGSLPDVVVTEEGVKFENTLFTPEDSMSIQMELGADIIMQLDDVVNPCDSKEKIEVAMRRSIRWMDRCITAVNRHEVDEHTKKLKKEDLPQIRLEEGSTQILFPIIQGGLDEELRAESIAEVLKRSPKGLAIGGLSGGEEKSEFARIVHFCIKNLPEGIPRYLMGVGYPEDIVVCVALGSDMSDCVYPTRTARFGRGFSDSGDVCFTSKLKYDKRKIDETCSCFVCSRYSRAFMFSIKGTTNFCMLLTIHNLHYMRNLTKRIRESIMEDKYPEFIKTFMGNRFKEIPEWIKIALRKVGVEV
ncbi:queuine tRNA-ribosyltransferase [Encephalitozoon intestinalis ATCC 50506]|uniref:Queuine tRNA-ribosyltransferase n=1 Tax=Encephalitozoon intestinalis (strain ATCC 50506) TaxID=876142 RepID=E0S7F2_ENCIT|nr:queuine tRNA-ribosyltransferase [Encephalitozoon intestinalis ATCC 50506]ADM11631.1 queuine tRNA-ribosyltransferase [Encephalitozoon intestinalis ATCC 50506]UTX45363.1 tRNA-guanine family transglycosylase [Encephalitozoon intestinalis]